MDRRRFLKVAGIAGPSVMAPIALREGRADSSRYDGPYWIMVNAGGGWDPTMLCDPKGGQPDDHTSVNQAYTPDAIDHAGPFAFAPIGLTVDGIDVMSNKTFFNKHRKRLMVLNGLDTTTNNHDGGSRNVWSGQ